MTERQQTLVAAVDRNRQLVLDAERPTPRPAIPNGKPTIT